MRVIWLFLLWTMLEIGLFASIGGRIGVLATWSIVLGSAVLGVWLIRWQKRTAPGQVMRDIRTLGDALNPAAHSALIVLAGVLLILPGFLTDLAGLALLLPPVRDVLIRVLRDKARKAGMHSGMGGMRPGPSPSRSADIIDGVAEEAPPTVTPLPKPSGWTKP